ncbi:hypothetical protein L7F22_064907 [Adiantum nelumboides]|nr:hypothetical protein [Adiantum nelumboides]
MKWIKQQNKGLSARELLREFEKRYDQLSAIEQRSIRSERVQLFVQATDACFQKSLEQLLEDTLSELGSTLDWKLVSDAVNVIVKQQMRVDKLTVIDSLEASDEEVKDKSATLKHMLEEPILDGLLKGKRIKLFKKQEGEFELEDLRSEPGIEVYALDDKFDDALDEAD